MPTSEKPSNPCEIVKEYNDYVVHLGTMRRAIVIAMYEDGRYGISIRSFFPFNEPTQKERYNTARTAMRVAFSVVRQWMESVLESDEVSIEEEMKQLSG